MWKSRLKSGGGSTKDFLVVKVSSQADCSKSVHFCRWRQKRNYKQQHVCFFTARFSSLQIRIHIQGDYRASLMHGGILLRYNT